MSTNILNRANKFRVFYLGPESNGNSADRSPITLDAVDQPKTEAELLKIVIAELQKSNALNERLSNQVEDLQAKVDYVTAPVDVKFKRGAKNLKDGTVENTKKNWSTFKSWDKAVDQATRKWEDDANRGVYEATKKIQPTTGTLGGDLRAVGGALVAGAVGAYKAGEAAVKATGDFLENEKKAGRTVENVARIAGTGAVAGAVGAYKLSETAVKGLGRGVVEGAKIAGAGIAAVTEPTIGKMSKAAEQRFNSDSARLDSRIQGRNQANDQLNNNRSALEANAIDDKANRNIETAMNAKIDTDLATSIGAIYNSIYRSQLFRGEKAALDFSKINTINDLHNVFLSNDGSIDQDEQSILDVALAGVKSGAANVATLNPLDNANVLTQKAGNKGKVLANQGMNLIDRGRERVSAGAANVAKVANMDAGDAITGAAKGLWNKITGGKKDAPVNTASSTSRRTTK